MGNSEKINKDITISELIEENPEMGNKLAELGLGCAGCPMSQMETIEEGALAHGINPEELIEELKSGESNE
tara:strand:- start:897 stop:1109 length:213 start_codon:yes stop_codon:yes gene_type:complete